MEGKFSYSAERQPFVAKGFNNDADDEVIANPSANLAKRWERVSSATKLSIHISALLLYTGLFAIAIRLYSQRPVHLNNALKDPRFQFETTKSITAGMSPYAGGPTDDVDDAWHDLMGNISVRVSQSELDMNGNHRSSVQLPVHGGHLVWLGVFHQLHCLKMIRKLNYRDYYFPNQTYDEIRDQEVHINHCIEMLRQAVMCNPDTSFTTFVWTHSDPKPVLDVRRFEKQCVNWERFMSNITPRTVSFDEVDALKNPLLGPVNK